MDLPRRMQMDQKPEKQTRRQKDQTLHSRRGYRMRLQKRLQKRQIRNREKAAAPEHLQQQSRGGECLKVQLEHRSLLRAWTVIW